MKKNSNTPIGKFEPLGAGGGHTSSKADLLSKVFLAGHCEHSILEHF